MSKIIKLIALLIALIIIATGVLIALLDPNDYKQELQALAAEQGIELRLKGDLSWQLWPSLGIQMSEVSVTPKLPASMKHNKMARRPLAEIQQLSASVQVIPLLSGAIAVDGIAVEKAHFYLEKNTQGRGNWELPSPTEKQALTSASSATQTTSSATDRPATPEAEGSSSALNLAINTIELRQISADYIDREKDQTLSLQQLNIAISQFNLNEKPFSVQMDWQTSIDDAASDSQLQNSGELNTQMTLSSDFQHYSFADTALTSELSGQAAQNNIERVVFSASDFNLNNNAFPLTLEWQLDLAAPKVSSLGKLSGQLRIPNAINSIHINDAELQSTLKGQGQSSEQQLSLSLDLTLPANDGDATEASGAVTVAPFNLKQLLQVLGQQAPVTSDSKALTKIAFSSQYHSDLNNLTLQKLQLQLDDTSIQGQVDIKEFDSAKALPKVIARLGGDQIDVDRYLAPETTAAEKVVATTAPAKQSTDKPAATSTAAAPKSASTVVIPVADLQPLRLDIGVDFDQMRLKKMRFDNAKVKLSADKGLLRLKQLDADFYRGTIKMTAQVDGRPGTQDHATLKSKGDMNNIELAPLLKDLELDQEYQLSGLLSASFSGHSRGVTDTKIMQLLVGKADINSPELTLKPINIEQKYCALVQASKMQGAKEEWPEQSTLKNLRGRVNIKKQIIAIDTFGAEVVNFKIGAKGNINLDSGNFLISYPITLTQAWTSEEGCRTKEKSLIGRELDIVESKGNLATDSILPPRFNSDNISKIVIEIGTEKLQKKLMEKLGLESKSTSTDSKDDGKEVEEVDPRDAIRGLFDSFIQKELKKQEEKNK